MIFFNLNLKKIFFGGCCLSIIGLIGIAFLRAHFFATLINQLLGHSVTLTGLQKIDRLYVAPLNWLLLAIGIFLLVVAFLVKFDSVNDRIFYFFKKIWRKIISFKIWQLVIFLFIFNFLVKFFLLVLTPEFTLAHDAVEYMDVAYNLLNGHGFVSRLVYDLSLVPALHLPYDLALFPPLFPIFLFLSFKVFGVSFLTAGLVNVIFSSLLPVALFALAKKLTVSKKIALLAALLLTFNNIIIAWSNQILTEIPYIFFSLMFLYFIIDSNGRCLKLLAAGGCLGLAYLIRFQTIVLLLPVLFVYYLSCDKKLNVFCKQSILKLIIIGLMALIVVCPWLIRNQLLFGNPFYASESTTTWLERYQGAGGAGDVSQLLIVAKNWLANMEVLWRKLSWQIIGFLMLSIFSLYGIWQTWKDDKRHYLFLYTYLILYFVFFAFFKPLPRYLYATTPIFVLFSAIGFKSFFEKYFKNHFWQAYVKASAIIFFILTIFWFGFGIKQALSQPIAEKDRTIDPMIAAETASDYLKNFEGDLTVMMAARRMNYLNYYRPGTKVIVFPEDEDVFKQVVIDFDVDYVVVPFASNLYYKEGRDAFGIIQAQDNWQLVWRQLNPDVRIYKRVVSE